MTEPLDEESTINHYTEKLWENLVKLPLHQVWYAQKDTQSEKGKRELAEKEILHLRKRLLASTNEVNRLLGIHIDLKKYVDKYNKNFLPAIQLQKAMHDLLKDLYKELGYNDHEQIYHSLMNTHRYDQLADYMRSPEVIEMFFGQGGQKSDNFPDKQKK